MGLSPCQTISRSADFLVQGWEKGLLAAFDVTLTSPLTPVNLEETSVLAGAANRIAETQKHSVNDTKCEELGWVYASSHWL